MAQEGGYAASGQFKSIADNAASAVLSVQQLAKDFVALSTAVAGIGTAVKEFGQLQQTLVLTNTVAQGNAQQLQAMNEAVRNMALNYKFSANEGAQALYFLSSAGFSVGESLRAMSGVTLLAQGTLSDLAQVADTVANTISAFGLQAGDSTRIANLFAAAISITQATMDKLAYSMRYVAPVAASMGASVEQTTVALSLLYNAGNRGQQAGTLLRDILVRLVNPSKEASEVLSQLGVSILDDTGKTRNFVDVLKQLSSLNLSPVTLSKVFEQRGVSGAQTLLASFDPNVFAKRLQDSDFAAQVDNIAKRAGVAATSIKNMYELMTAAETGTTFATKLAIEQNNTLAGSFSKAKNALTEVGITLGEQLAPGLTTIANNVTDLVKSFRALDDGTKKIITNLPLLAIVGIGIGKAFGGIQSSVFGAIGAFAQFRTAVNEVRSAQDTLRAAMDATNQLVNRQNGLLVNAFARANGGVGFRYAPGQGQGGFVGAANVTTQAQFAENAYQQARQDYARSAAQFGPRGPAPVAPTTITEARASSAAAAAGAASIALSGISAIVSGVLAVVSIGAMVAVAWPFIKDYITSKPGHSDVGGPQENTSVNDVAAILSTPAPNLEKIQSLQGLSSEKQTSLDFFNQVLKDRIELQTKAKAEMVEYVAKQVELNGDIKRANEIRKTGDISFVELAQGQLNTSEGFVNPELIVAAGISQSEEFKRIKKDADDARAAADSAGKSVENLTAYKNYVVEKIAQLVGLNSTKLEQAQKDALNLVGVKQGGDQLVVVLTEWLTGLEKKSREAQVAAAKAAADLSQNPVDKYIAEIVQNQLNVVDKLKSASDSIRTQFDKEIGTLANNTVAPELKDQIGKILAGLSWTEIIRGELVDGEVKVNHEGLADAIAKGMDPKAAFAEFQKGVDLASANLSQQNPAIKAALDRLRALSLSQFQAIINEDQSARIKGLFEIFQKQRENRQFYQQLRDELTTYNNQYLDALDTATGGTLPQIKLNTGFNNLNKQFSDELAKIDQQRLDLIKKLGGEASNITPDKLREITGQANSTVQPLADAAQRAYVQQAQNLINNFKQAQLKVDVEAKNALASATTLQASINDSLAGLYARMGLQIPRQVFSSAANLDFAQEEQRITQQVGQLKEQLLLLQQQKAELDRLSANPQLLAQGGKIPNAPLSLVGGPAEQMQEALKRGTDDFQDKFGTKLNIFTDKFNDVLTNFLNAFGTKLTGAAVQVPAQALPYQNIGGLNGPANGGFPSLPSVITTGTSQPVYLTNGTSTQPVNASDYLFKTNYANTGNAQVGVAQTVTTDSGLTFQAGQQAAEALKAFVNQLQASGAPIRSIEGENVRNIAGTNTLSQHAFGNAIDINQSRRNVVSPDFEAWIQQNPEAFRAALRDNGVVSGGDWKNPDLGHFEFGGVKPGASLAFSGGDQPQVDPTKIQQTNQFWQQQADLITGINTDIAKLPGLQDQVTAATGQTNQQLQKSLDDNSAVTQKTQEALSAVQQLQQQYQQYKISPDGQDVANWNAYSRAVQQAGKDVQGSNDMFKGLQVANAQLTVQLGRDAKLAADVYQSAANSIATNLTALIVGTQKDWRVALKNIATDIATTIIKALILRAITGVVGGGLGGIASFGGVTGKAMGGAYAGSEEVPIAKFAAGGVFDNPTAFQFMQGGQRKPGMLGEAGPEAIMPLVRGPDGKLAVRALSTPISPIIGGSDRGSGQGGLTYSPAFHFYGDSGQQSSTPGGNDRQQRNRMVSMQKELDREMESTFVRVASKYQRSGGFLNPAGQRLGITGPQ